MIHYAFSKVGLYSWRYFKFAGGIILQLSKSSSRALRELKLAFLIECFALWVGILKVAHWSWKRWLQHCVFNIRRLIYMVFTVKLSWDDCHLTIVMINHNLFRLGTVWQQAIIIPVLWRHMAPPWVYWWQVIIGSGNGFLLSANKLLSDPVIKVSIYIFITYSPNKNIWCI